MHHSHNACHCQHVMRRDGQPENALREVVRCCQRPLLERGGVKPTQLFSRNADVDRVNTAELAGLAHPQASWPASSSPCMQPLGCILNPLERKQWLPTDPAALIRHPSEEAPY